MDSTKREQAATLAAQLNDSLTLQQLRPDIFAHGTVTLKRIGAQVPKSLLRVSTIQAHLVDGNGTCHTLTANDLATLNPGLAIHPKYRV